MLLRRREVLLAGEGAAVAVWAPPGTWRAYLWTSKHDNLAFYARHGYVVTAQTEVAPGVTAWSAWRDPR